MKFRSELIIEAIRFDGTPGGAVDLFEQFDIAGAKFLPFRDLRAGTLSIPTEDKIQIAKRGDWVVKGVNGDYFVIDSKTFDDSYEKISENV